MFVEPLQNGQDISCSQKVSISCLTGKLVQGQNMEYWLLIVCNGKPTKSHIFKTIIELPLWCIFSVEIRIQERTKMFYLTTHLTHFIYGYMTLDI